MKILIFGASGTGTTTLGRPLAENLGYTLLDVNDYLRNTTFDLAIFLWLPPNIRLPNTETERRFNE